MSSHCNLKSKIVYIIFLQLVVLGICGCEALSSAVLKSPIPARIAMGDEKRPQVSFSHVHLYVDHLKDLEVYKDLEDRLNALVQECPTPLGSDLLGQRKRWESMQPDHFSGHPETFVPQNRDLVQQLLSGFGFRVTAARYDNTRTVLVTSKDPSGVQFLLTAKEDAPTVASSQQDYPHFDADCLDRFYKSHAGRPGIAVLAFLVQDAGVILRRYQQHHPNLVVGMWEYLDVKILEVYAYYARGDEVQDRTKRQADQGTILRFVEDRRQGASEHARIVCPVPGLTPVEAKFDDSTQAAYCDHWVSNVFHRREFLDTLEDTLDFTPKVDFNAGVVAAGEAQIESTVTGNDAATLVDNLSKEEALRDQSQVYLPINNALSSVGHVHGFLQELGQGIQHIASRVDDLVAFVQRANDSRKIIGEGFTFLRIPRSYYGVVTIPYLMSVETPGEDGDPGISETCARAILEACIRGQVTSKDGAVDLELTREDIEQKLVASMPEEHQGILKTRKDDILNAILQSRYSNLYSLLRHHVTEETYLGIVRNQILVDVQGEDLLYQIFSSNILQRNPGDEAPFLEFIQRVCSVCTDENGCAQKVKPGCGGFGIRNFLTLFLSIEVSKAMQEVTDAMEAGDLERQTYGEQMVELFTRQLNEANPILTAISDAMTDEGRYLQAMEKAVASAASDDDVAALQAKMDEACKKKQAGNEALMECSARYNALMKSLREARTKH